MPLAIEIKELSKRYETTTALDRISFEVQPGEIMGFLGPNGAGKTTTLRILTGLLAPTLGSVRINGLNAETQSLAIRRQIGYLPENVSLYPELRVDEYLAYRARIKGVSRKARRRRLDEVMGQCALGDVRRQLIGRLSRGYRQRVALADCLIGSPSVLILDEPTVGLDPHQIRQTRELIRSFGRQITVLLSTHILPEVEMTCHRVTIIDKGRIVAVDTPENLQRRLTGSQVVRVELRGDDATMEQALGQLAGVARVIRQDSSDLSAPPENVGGGQAGRSATFEVEAQAGSDVREAIFRLAVERQWVLHQLATVHASLEDVFIHVTTKETE